MEVYGRRIFAIILARLHDPDVAEDLTQEALLATLGNLRNGTLLEPDKLPAYLRGTARNLCNNHLRGLSRRPATIEVEPPSGNPNPEVRFRHRELLTLAGQFAAELGDADRKILLWSLVDRLGAEEIGNRLEMRADTVRQHKHRALEKIRERIRNLSQDSAADHKVPGGSR